MRLCKILAIDAIDLYSWLITASLLWSHVNVCMLNCLLKSKYASSLSYATIHLIS